jgi:hypothetical protein
MDNKNKQRQLSVAQDKNKLNLKLFMYSARTVLYISKIFKPKKGGDN